MNWRLIIGLWLAVLICGAIGVDARGAFGLAFGYTFLNAIGATS